MKQPRKNRLPKKIWKWTLLETFGYGFLIILLTLFLHGAINRTIENTKLANHGIICKAYVTDKEKHGGKGRTTLTVKYTVNDTQFINTTTNEPWEVGDSVDIICLPDDPQVIRSARFIKK